jgi:hypothetical protein
MSTARDCVRHCGIWSKHEAALGKIDALAGSNFGLKAVALTIAVGLWLAGHRDI